MYVHGHLSKFLLVILITLIFSVSIAVGNCPCSRDNHEIQNASSIANHLTISNSNVSENEINTSVGGIYWIIIQGHVTSISQDQDITIYIDKVLQGFGLGGLEGFRLVPGAIVYTYIGYPDISVGDCVEVKGVWVTTDSPPIYLGDPGSYINKISCPSLNHPPTVPTKPSGTKAGYKGILYSYSTSAKDIDRDHVKYAFDWGDSTTAETAFVKSGMKASASHTWTNAGTYLVKAKATDSKGASSVSSSTLTVTIAVNNPPNVPNPPSGPNIGKTRKTYRYSVSTTDPDGDKVKFTSDWGDGTTSVTGLVKSSTSARIIHNWRKPGTYQVKVLAEDSKGTSSISWSNSLTVTIT